MWVLSTGASFRAGALLFGELIIGVGAGTGGGATSGVWAVFRDAPSEDSTSSWAYWNSSYSFSNMSNDSLKIKYH